jgi:hypothetical protein
LKSAAVSALTASRSTLEIRAIAHLLIPAYRNTGAMRAGGSGVV